MTILRTVLERESLLGLKMSLLSFRYSKSIEDKPVRTKDVGVGTYDKVTKRLHSELLEKYNTLIRKKKARSERSPRIYIASSKKIETDMQERVSRGTSPALDMNGLLYIPHKPWFISQWFYSADGLRYGITVDTNNPDVMDILQRYSQESTSHLDPDSSGNAVLTFTLKSGEEITLRFNKWDARTLEVLSQATLISTGWPPSVGIGF